MLIWSTGKGCTKPRRPGFPMNFPMSMPATAPIGGRLSASLSMQNMIPWFAPTKDAFPTMVKLMRMLSSVWRISSTTFWWARICAGELPSCATMTPKSTPESPTGRKVVLTTVKSQSVPAMQTPQVRTESHPWRSPKRSVLA